MIRSRNFVILGILPLLLLGCFSRKKEPEPASLSAEALDPFADLEDPFADLEERTQETPAADLSTGGRGSFAPGSTGVGAESHGLADRPETVVGKIPGAKILGEETPGLPDLPASVGDDEGATSSSPIIAGGPINAEIPARQTTPSRGSETSSPIPEVGAAQSTGSAGGSVPFEYDRQTIDPFQAADKGLGESWNASGEKGFGEKDQAPALRLSTHPPSAAGENVFPPRFSEAPAFGNPDNFQDLRPPRLPNGSEGPGFEVAEREGSSHTPNVGQNSVAPDLPNVESFERQTQPLQNNREEYQFPHRTAPSFQESPDLAGSPTGFGSDREMDFSSQAARRNVPEPGREKDSTEVSFDSESPQDPSQLKAEGVDLYKAGRFPEAIQAFRKYIASGYPDENQEVQWRLAQALYGSGRWAESAAEFNKLIGSPNPEYRADALFKLGLIDRQKGDWESAGTMS